ncbi:PREDICTED: zinc finger protein 511, partial [Bison bison bison]|uniref:Zinc finger protein 511 n=1 Tax=Bison bison bison TaxID=43346 RepID=A0A6P3HE27_BISBB
QVDVDLGTISSMHPQKAEQLIDIVVNPKFTHDFGSETSQSSPGRPPTTPCADQAVGPLPGEALPSPCWWGQSQWAALGNRSPDSELRQLRPSCLPQDGDVQRHLYLQDVITQVAAEPERPRVPEFTCQVAGCCQAFDALEDYEHHYHTLHGNVCSSCKRAFPSGHLLDTHIQEWHDSLFQILAERQDMYQCLVEGCTEKFRTSRDRKEHLVTHHLYPADFRFDKPRKGRRYVGARGSRLLSSAGLRVCGLRGCGRPRAAPLTPNVTFSCGLTLGVGSY